MKSIKRTVLAVALVGLLAGTTGAFAQQPPPGQDNPGQRQRQGPGNFDPAQMQQRMMERYREQLEIKDDAEGKAIEGLITKVNEARREVGFGGGRGMFGGPQRNRQQGDNAAQGQGQGQNRRGFGPTPSPEAEALQKAIDSKAGAAELKAAMAKYREARKANEAKLAKAQEELRAVLSVRQEAIALSMGLLN